MIDCPRPSRKRRMSDDKIIDTVIALDSAMTVLFSVLSEQQPNIAEKVREQLLAATQLNYPELRQSFQRVLDYAELLKPKMPKLPFGH